MKISAIICEFNPLHSGHVRLIEYAKSIADAVVCIMSGNFTQRGLPACADKYARARHAVCAGADLVIELPTAIATSSAQNFALGGVHIANRIDADYLVFGSECGNIDELKACAEALSSEETNAKIRLELAKGVSYPKAVSLATGNALLDKPNNVLAVEYLRAMKETGSKMTPATIKREDNYNSNVAAEFASSSALRQNAELRALYMPQFALRDINDDIEQNYKTFACAALAAMPKSRIEQIEGVTEGLENRIASADKTLGFDGMLDEIKTKRYTRMKLQRIVLNCVLNITKEVAESRKHSDIALPLAVSAESRALLSLADKNNYDEVTCCADGLYEVLCGKKLPKNFQIV